MKTTSNTSSAQSVTFGTSHFESLAAAREYYRPYFGDGFGRREAQHEKLAQYVSGKLDSGEIHIGRPVLKPGQKLFLHREERRYFITENTATA